MNKLITTQLHIEEPVASIAKHAEPSKPGHVSTLRAIASLAAILAGLLAAPLNLAHATPSPPTAAEIKIEERALRVYAARSYLTELRRAERVVYTLLKAATPYCVNRRKYSLGVPPLSANDLPIELRLGFTEWVATDKPDALRFMHVHGLSPAARAGVQEGDILLSMIDQATGKQLVSGWVMNRPINTLVSNEPIALEVERNKTKFALRAVPQLICDLKLRLVRTDDLIARADADSVTVSTGLLRFVQSDDELALLLANELMHNQLRLARSSKTRPKITKSEFVAPYTQDEEYEADYLSAYLVVAARFNLTEAQDIWKRLANNSKDKIKDSVALRHPLTATRSFYLGSIKEEIVRKTQTGERIVPRAQSALALADSDFDAAAAALFHQNTGPLRKPASDDNPQLRSVTNIPFIDNEGLAGYQRFLDSPLRPRAFAIGPNKNTSRGAWAYKVGANASADALAHCTLLRRGPCYLYAVDDQVVWNPETAQDQPEAKQTSAAGASLTQVPPATGFALIEDIAAVPLPQAELARYQAFLEKPSPRAFVILQKGVGRYWVGPASMHDALAYCARSDDSCWLYAVNDSVVWSKDVAKRISSRDQLTTNKDESGFLEK